MVQETEAVGIYVGEKSEFIAAQPPNDAKRKVGKTQGPDQTPGTELLMAG